MISIEFCLMNQAGSLFLPFIYSLIVFSPLESKLSEGATLPVLLTIPPESVSVPVVGMNRYLMSEE